MSIYIPGAKRVKSIFASVPFMDIKEFNLYGKAKQKTTTGKNLIPYPYIKESNTSNGITFTVEDNGTVIANGTNNGTQSAIHLQTIRLKAGETYKISHGTTLSSEIKSFCVVYFKADNGNSKVPDAVAIHPISGEWVKVTTDYVSTLNGGNFYIDRTFTVNEDINVQFQCRINNNGIATDLIFYPMLRLASITDDTWEQPTNGATPRPDYPQEIEVAGSSGNVEITSSNEDGSKIVTATIPTPNGLAGIKVSSNGNYTDQNGQQWICDEVVKYADGSGEYIQRVAKTVLDGSEDEGWGMSGTVSGRMYAKVFTSNGINNFISNMCSQVSALPTETIGTAFLSDTGTINILTAFTDADSWKTHLASKNMIVYYRLAEPITTPLTAEQLAEIDKLAEIYPANNISNNSFCDLSVSFDKHYETKKIVSAWANKDGLPVKVFSSEMGPRFVCVGDNGNTYCSLDGETWMAMEGLDSTDNYYSLTYANGAFICMGQNGGVYRLLQNSKKWKFVTSLNVGESFKNGLAYGDGVFVYVGKGGKSYYSTDGETWFALSGLSANYTYRGIAYGEIANGESYRYFVCVGEGGKSYYISSKDLKSSSTKKWTAMTGVIETTNSLSAVTFGDGRFVCVDNYGYTFYSTDGKTWTSGDQLKTNSHNSITCDNERYVIVSNSGKSYYSTNGVYWYEMSGLSNTTYLSVTYGNGKFVCVGYYGRCYYSTDGETWVAMERLPSDIDFNAVCFSVDGGYGDLQ